MLNTFKFLSALCFLSIVAACAPTTTGATTTSAFDLSEVDTLTVNGGANWYFFRTFPAAYFDVDLGDIPGRAFGGKAGAEYTHIITNRFKVETLGLPENWDVRLHSVKGTQKLASVETQGRRTSVRWHETVTVYLVMSPPQNTPSGNYEGVVTIISDKGEVGALPLNVVVDYPAPIDQLAQAY